ncbi:hypothetical protein J6590_101371 [Homalodisca vitripennis]|nr:hypothetical protein J6590_101371 [Homalodisca vitripennis]
MPKSLKSGKPMDVQKLLITNRKCQDLEKTPELACPSFKVTDDLDSTLIPSLTILTGGCSYSQPHQSEM